MIGEDVLSDEPTVDELADYLRNVAIRLDDAIERLERLVEKDRRDRG